MQTPATAWRRPHFHTMYHGNGEKNASRIIHRKYAYKVHLALTYRKCMVNMHRRCMSYTRTCRKYAYKCSSWRTTYRKYAYNEKTKQKYVVDMHTNVCRTIASLVNINTMACQKKYIIINSHKYACKVALGGHLGSPGALLYACLQCFLHVRCHFTSITDQL